MTALVSFSHRIGIGRWWHRVFYEAGRLRRGRLAAVAQHILQVPFADDVSVERHPTVAEEVGTRRAPHQVAVLLRCCRRPGGTRKKTMELYLFFVSVCRSSKIPSRTPQKPKRTPWGHDPPLRNPPPSEEIGPDCRIWHRPWFSIL